MARGEHNRTSIVVPERLIPVPRTFSPQAQEFLSHAPPLGRPHMPSDSADKAAWHAYIEKINPMLTAIAARHAERFPATELSHRLSSALLYETVPQTIAAENEACAILHVHGGGFVVGHGIAAFYMGLPIASIARTRTFSIDYRIPPDDPFPAALDDTIEAYQWLLSRYKPQNIGFFGASAGGNLVPAAVLKARDMGLPMPGACALHSPGCDATESGDTYETNRIIDTVLEERTSSLFAVYADGHDLRDPLVSPLFGDFTKGFPPTILTSGTRDLLLSSTVLLHRALRRAGIKAELHVWEAMTHLIFPDAPEEVELYREHAQFLLSHLAAH